MLTAVFGCGDAMMPSAATNPYKHHRFPGEIISHAVWLYFRFPLSHRYVEELLFVRGVIVSYEAIRLASPPEQKSCGST